MTLLAGRYPSELEYVQIAFWHRGMGGLLDPSAVRAWHERVAADVLLVLVNLNGTRKGTEY